PVPATPRRPAPRGEGEILLWTKGTARLLTPDGKVVRSWEGEQVPLATGARLSPDGRRIAVLRVTETRTQNKAVEAGGGRLQGPFSWTLAKLTIYPVAEKLAGVDVPLPGDAVESVAWSAGGSRLYVGTYDDDEDNPYAQSKNLRYHVLDATTFERTPLTLP